jgi:hypothetical protein
VLRWGVFQLRSPLKAGAAALLVVTGATVWLAIWLPQERPVSLRGHLTEFGTTSLSFGIQADGGTSPACGCMYPGVNDWRGITFASRGVTITPTGAPWTAYQITLPDPEPITAFGQRTFLQADVIRTQVLGSPTDSELAKWLLNGNPNLVATRKQGIVKLVEQLVTRAPLHVALLGPVPIGAWIPLPDSQVVLSSQADNIFDDQPPLATLIETFTGREGIDSNSEQAQYQGWPLADFTGPEVVMWTTDPKAQVPLGPSSSSTARFSSDSAAEDVTAIVIRGGDYAVRVAVTPLTGLSFNRVPRLSGEGSSGGILTPSLPDSGGQVSIIDDEPITGRAYQALRASVTANPVTAARLRSNITVEAPGESSSTSKYIEEAFAYPPLPPSGGFNVFGPLSDLSFSDANGEISASGRYIPLASSDVVMRDVKNLEDSRTGQQLVQVPLYTTQADANLNFNSIGELFVDGIAETIREQNYQDLFSGGTAYIAVVGLILGVIGVWYAARADMAERRRSAAERAKLAQLELPAPPHPTGERPPVITQRRGGHARPGP